MRFGITAKTWTLIFLLLSISGIIAIVISFVFYQESDRFRIFMRGLMLCIFVYNTFLYGRRYKRALKK